MYDDTHHDTDSGPQMPTGSILAGFVGFLLLVAVYVGVLLLGSGGVVSLTEFLATWVGVPPMSMLVAFLGLSLIAAVFVAHTRILAAIQEARLDPFEMLRDRIERAAIDREDERDDEWEDDGEDEWEDDGLEFVPRRRKVGGAKRGKVGGAKRGKVGGAKRGKR